MNHSADSLRRSHTPITRLFPLFLLILLSFSLAPASLAQDDFSVGTLPDIQRMRALADACADLELNSLCYGGGNVQVTTDGTTTTLSEVGARLPLAGVQRIETTVDEASCAWGGVALKLQGTAGASQPGMTYVALGNVVLENATAPEALFAPVAPRQISVNTDNLNFRAAPSLEAEVIGQFDTGELLNTDALNPDGTWLRVESSGGTGWVAREFTDSAEDLSALPMLNESSKGWMQDFTLHTASSACPATLPSLLVVQTPSPRSGAGGRVPLNVNGTDISVGSTIAFNTVSDAALGGPDTVDPSDTELGGPDTVDPAESELGGPDTAEVTQMVVIDGSLMLPGLEPGGVTYGYADETGKIVGYGLTLNTDNDNNVADFMVPEGTGIVLKPSGEQPEGPIIGAIIGTIAAINSIIAQQMAADLEDQAEQKLTPGVVNLLDETTTDAAVPVGTPSAESTSLSVSQFMLNVGEDGTPSVDLMLQLPEEIVFAEQLDGLQLLGRVLPEDDDPIKLNFPDYFDDWLSVNMKEIGPLCDAFQGISPHSGDIVLPPDSNLNFSFPMESGLMSQWYAAGGSDGYGVHAFTKFHLARVASSELKSQEMQVYDLSQDDLAIYADNQGIVNLSYNYYQLQQLSLITPGQTSGTLVWWAENTVALMHSEELWDTLADMMDGPDTPEENIWEAIHEMIDDDSDDLFVMEHSCITDLYVLNWWDGETVELSDELIDPELAPIDDTIPDFDIDFDPTPTHGHGTEPIVPLLTEVPARDSDGDGVLDDADRCPAERGVPENNGCPLPPTAPPARDSDGDGVPDDQDRCPVERGVPENNGCPLRRAGS